MAIVLTIMVGFALMTATLRLGDMVMAHHRALASRRPSGNRETPGLSDLRV